MVRRGVQSAKRRSAAAVRARAATTVDLSLSERPLRIAGNATATETIARIAENTLDEGTGPKILHRFARRNHRFIYKFSSCFKVSISFGKTLYVKICLVKFCFTLAQTCNIVQWKGEKIKQKKLLFFPHHPLRKESR